MSGYEIIADGRTAGPRVSSPSGGHLIPCGGQLTLGPQVGGTAGPSAIGPGGHYLGGTAGTRATGPGGTAGPRVSSPSRCDTVTHPTLISIVQMCASDLSELLTIVVG